ncbi:hypothetical protein E8D34_07760 [Nocardioides sp. GY 10113]|uniref:hypothetical protein n=1 Tax=Nocardioides sp. GY 10113 TaxID=2569761 RepID=UPI0010A7DD30|nr:hypothetical protein [Nocardioides sp. GY 10113]TIC88164.1 hypothetical protein E8D34_07760 [Nocardioides sp. GY 10113]
MHARSTTFHGRPGNIDAGIAFVRNEAWPALERIEGCRGISLLVDRQTGQCIATSSWASQEAMHASDAALRPIRDRGRDILGATMEMDEWEIAVMHRTQHGACCRVSWMEGDVPSMLETLRVGVLPALEQTDGFCGVSVLVNRADGLGCATTVWDSHTAMEASRAMADDLRDRTASEAGGMVAEVHEYDLAYAHLHVPEMA